MTRRLGAALLTSLLLLTVGCTTAASGARSTGTASLGATAVGTGAVSRAEPPCTTATQPARSLPAGATAMTKPSRPGTPGGVLSDGTPFGVAVAPGARWAFASVGSDLAVLRLSAGRPADPVYSIGLPESTDGVALTPDGRYRFGAAKSASLAVVDVADALAGRPALVGYLPAGQFPRGLAAGPGGGTVLVANYESGQIETVNGAALP